MRRWLHKILLLALGISLGAVSTQAHAALQVKVAPAAISIDTFYNGGQLLVSGQLPEDCEAVVRVVGERSDLQLKKKGKVGGILWMNMDTVTFNDLPNVLIIQTAKDFRALLGAHPENTAGWRLGLEALEETTSIVPQPTDKITLFKELRKLKEEQGLYAVSSKNLHYQESSGGQKSFEVGIPIAPRFPPGNYTVEVYALREGEVVEQDRQPLEVKLVSFPGMLAALAFQHSALYGLCAVVIAIVAGLLTGILFSGGKGGSH
jgi:uncharacterized protein (TIGR02186 family)